MAGLGSLIGCTKTAVNDWEKGHRRPADAALAAIAEHTGVTANWLQAGRLSVDGARVVRLFNRLDADEQDRIVLMLQTLPADPSQGR